MVGQGTTPDGIGRLKPIWPRPMRNPAEVGIFVFFYSVFSNCRQVVEPCPAVVFFCVQEYQGPSSNRHREVHCFPSWQHVAAEIDHKIKITVVLCIISAGRIAGLLLPYWVTG